ncbi:MAG: hypothetical protein QNK35_05280, partial [Bacteroides sp.]|nr:hypothetical protein [Bacteroides sp.]
FNLMIRRRIKIMCRSRSGSMAKLKPLLIIPVALCLTLLFVCSNTVDHLHHLNAGLGENVIKIDDQRDKLTECVNFLKLGGARNHDVEVKRVRIVDGREAYFMNFFLVNSASPEPAVFGYLTDEDFNLLRYQWRGDTALVKLENSLTKAHMDFEWKPSESGSSLLRIDTPNSIFHHHPGK